MDVADHPTVGLSPAALTTLATNLRGALVLPGEPTYDQERRIWNGAHDRHPAAVIRCAGVADVILAIGLARREGVPLAVRGGGHSVPGFSTCDGGIIIDLALMKGVRVNPGDHRLQAQTGCLWRDVDVETQQFNLAVTGGLVSTTGISGFTLGGGIGWLTRLCGLAADNLVGADVVTADGQFVQAQDDPDLLWALKGGGGNFGVVTAMDFDLVKVGPTVFAGSVTYPADESEDVLARYAAACAHAPDGLTTLLKLTTAPSWPSTDIDSPPTPVITVAGCATGDPDAAVRAAEPFRRLGHQQSDGFAHRSYTTWQRALDRQFPRGLHCYFRSAFIEELTEDRIASLVAAHRRLPNRLTEIVVHQLGGAMARHGHADTAFATRDHRFIVNVIARSQDPAEYPAAVDFARLTIADTAPDAPDYVNFNAENGPRASLSSYPPETFSRLTMVKNRYDGANMFRLNHNIPPTV